MDAFLDLAFSVIVDERVRRGWKLDDALEEMKEYARGSSLSETIIRSGTGTNTTVETSEVPASGVGGPGQPVSAAELANVNALAMFEAAMATTSGVR